MWTYDKTETARKYRLTITMCLALLGVGTVKRMATVRALESRGLVVTTDSGWYMTEAGIEAAGAMKAEADILTNLSEQEAATHRAAADPRAAEVTQEAYTGPRIGDEVTDGTDDGIVRELAARSGTAGAVVDFPEGSKWVPLGDLTITTDRARTAPLEDLSSPEDDDDPLDAPVLVEPYAVTASDVHRGDVIEHNGERVTVTDVGSAGSDVVISLGARRALTMSPTTPVRRAATAQLSLIA